MDWVRGLADDETRHDQLVEAGGNSLVLVLANSIRGQWEPFYMVSEDHTQNPELRRQVTKADNGRTPVLKVAEYLERYITEKEEGRRSRFAGLFLVSDLDPFREAYINTPNGIDMIAEENV